MNIRPVAVARTMRLRRSRIWRGESGVALQQVQAAANAGEHQPAGDAVPGDVAHRDAEAAIVRLEVLVVVAADLGGGERHAGDVELLETRISGGQHAQLDLPRRVELLAHALAIAMPAHLDLELIHEAAIARPHQRRVDEQAAERGRDLADEDRDGERRLLDRGVAKVERGACGGDRGEGGEAGEDAEAERHQDHRTDEAEHTQPGREAREVERKEGRLQGEVAEQDGLEAGASPRLRKQPRRRAGRVRRSRAAARGGRSRPGRSTTGRAPRRRRRRRGPRRAAAGSSTRRGGAAPPPWPEGGPGSRDGLRTGSPSPAVP